MHIRAYAKINPFLEITGRHNDGYHELSIIFRPVSLYDELDIEIIDSSTSEVQLSCNKEEFAGEDNIIHKAYEELSAYLKKNYPKKKLNSFKVKLTKHIPSGAGMAGGSTDASAFLYAANQLSKLELSLEELMEIGAKVGADVPACLLRKPSYATGIGEKLEIIENSAKVYYVIVKPSVSFNTGLMFRTYDELLKAGKLPKNKKDAGRVARAIKRGDIKSEARNLYNVFEKVVPEKSLIRKIKKSLLNAGALGAVLTGSGSCVVGTFDDKVKRDEAFGKLKKEYSEVYSCESINEDRI